LNGHLHLTAARYDNGQTYLREQSFRAPLHISKPHEDAGALVVNIVNPTAGIFDGDVIELSTEAEAGSSLVLTTPSASRIYRSRCGGPARVQQSFSAHAGAFLEYYPEPFIPQAGARIQQKTELHASAGGSLLFFDWLTPGRVASGEIFQYADLCWDLDAYVDARLVARERYRLCPGDRSLESLRIQYPQCHYLSCVILSGAASTHFEVESLNNGKVYLGQSALFEGGWIIKALCADSLSARHTLQSLRALVYHALQRPLPSLGRQM
jgi:urease accessory protein